jgi:hypothetical protein
MCAYEFVMYICVMCMHVCKYARIRVHHPREACTPENVHANVYSREACTHENVHTNVYTIPERQKREREYCHIFKTCERDPVTFARMHVIS